MAPAFPASAPLSGTAPAGRLLLIKRGHDPEAGKWSLPGGRIEPGETAGDDGSRERLLEIIGEPANSLSDEFRAQTGSRPASD